MYISDLTSERMSYSSSSVLSTFIVQRSTFHAMSRQLYSSVCSNVYLIVCLHLTMSSVSMKAASTTNSWWIYYFYLINCQNIFLLWCAHAQKQQTAVNLERNVLHNLICVGAKTICKNIQQSLNSQRHQASSWDRLQECGYIQAHYNLPSPPCCTTLLYDHQPA